MRRRTAVVALALLVTMAACSSSDDDDEQADATTTTSSSTTTTTPATAAPELSDCPSRPGGSSPAVFDDAAGTYAAQAVEVVDAGLRFDVVQWLSGEDADAAYEAETGDSSGVPNDHFIVNESPELREAPLDAGARVIVLDVDATASLREIEADGLGAHLAETAQDTWWLTFEEGMVTEVCQQYRP